MESILVLDLPSSWGLNPAILGAKKLAGLGTDFDENVVTFVFNDITIAVRWDSDPELIYRDYSRAYSGYIPPSVGPYPSLELTSEEIASDVRIRSENNLRYERWLAEVGAEEESHHSG